jgi:RHS repeat-associated protein
MDTIPLSIPFNATQAYYRWYDPNLLRQHPLTSNTPATILRNIDYDTFGNIIADTNPTFTIPFGFAGGLCDRDTGLVRFGFRDYDPDVGRWTAKDPIGFAGGDTDLYGYVGNNPITFVDPFGVRKVMIGYRPGHNGESVPLVYDTETGRTTIGFPGTYTDPFTQCMRDALDTAVDQYIDPFFNNSLTENLAEIPPGQSIGDPNVDLALRIFKLMRGYWNWFRGKR